ncbi:hypothetical protein [Tropicimonas sediminicola]|uniref:hypothetical protein n=1 Tax=Tropicimonas sediminicola TaxID=1031541 RepID=UPI0015961403|nr:hypothetical protein [Tropicimonas sediminicola]
MFGVSPTTEQLWPLLQSGIETADFAARAAELGDDGFAVIDQLVAIGAVQYIATDEQPLDVHERVTISVGHTAIGLSFSGPIALARLRCVFRHLETPALPDAEVVIVEREDGVGIAFSGDAPESYAWHEAGPALKLLITELALDAAMGMTLHLGTLQRDNEALLLVGEPGAGKSTLSVALGSGDFELWGDDLAELRPDGRVQALPLPATLKDGAWPMLAHLHPELEGGEAFVRPDDKTVKYLPLPPATKAPVLRARCALSLRRDDAAPPGLEPLDAKDFIAAMIAGGWSGDHRLTPDDFDGLAACADGIAFFRATYPDLPTALSLVEEAWRISGTAR